MFRNLDLLVLDENYQSIAIFDVFDSLIWVDRYNEYGDFEIFIPVSEEVLSYLQKDYYVYFKESEHLMIIEDIKIVSNIEEGNYLIVTGRSLESILDRRIIWEQTVLTGNFQNGIQSLLNSSIINPTITDRKISNFIFEASTDLAITSLEFDVQINRGLNLYEVIRDLCVERNIGFKVILNDNNQFVFSLYAGEDRSYEQSVNPYVVFSQGFDNLVEVNYSESKRLHKNVTLVAGEGDEMDRKSTIVGVQQGLVRREMYSNASEISQSNQGVTMTDAEYVLQLIQRGKVDLSKAIVHKDIDCKIDNTSPMFEYKDDYFMGDVVQINVGYGIETRARVVEMMYSVSHEGVESYPIMIINDVEEFDYDGVLIPGQGGT